MASRARFGLSLLAAVCAVTLLSSGSAEARQCGLFSGNYARTCSPHAASACLRAAARNVPGFTVLKCRQAAALCSKCLKTTLACANRVDRPGRSKAAITKSCETCDAGFSRCMGKD